MISGGEFVEVEIGPATVAAALSAPPSAGTIDEAVPPCRGRGGEEVAATLPPSRISRADQPHICLVNQRSGLQRLTGGLARHSCRGELSQFVVDQRQQVGGGLAAASRCRAEQAGNVGHC